MSTATAIQVGDFLNGTPATTTAPGTPGVLPALNLINSLAHGDVVGAGINTLALMNPVTFGPLAIAYTVFSLIKGLFGGDDPEPWASGRWGWNGQGQPVPLVTGGDGIQITAKDPSGVAFDVDDSGFLKATGWLANEGADSDGFLWLDRGLYPSPYGRITRTFLHSCPIRAANDPPHRMAA